MTGFEIVSEIRLMIMDAYFILQLYNCHIIILHYIKYIYSIYI